MCDTQFSFGQRGSHFSQCPSQRILSHLPAKFEALLNSVRAQHVHHVALGSEDSFVITWRDSFGQDHIDCDGIPSELKSFLYGRNARGNLARNIPKIRCVLGPYNASFFAHDGMAYLWMNLPAKLLSAIQSRIGNGNWIDKPRILALGAEGNFALVTEKNAVVWELSAYRTVADLLRHVGTQEGGYSNIVNLVLHPYRFHCHVLHHRDGSLKFDNLPPHQTTNIQAIIDPVLQDAADLENSQRLGRRNSNMINSPPHRSRLIQGSHRLQREWDEHQRQFNARSKGLKLSLSLSISATASLSKILV